MTFDLWHTLVYLDAAAEDRYLEALRGSAVEALEGCPRKEGAPERSREELGGIFDRSLRGAIDAAADGRTITPVEQFEEAARMAGRRPQTDEYLGRLERLVRSTGFRAAPGARETLEALAGEGFRMAVISNTVAEPGRLFRPLLHDLGLDRHLSAAVFSDEHPWAKPSPEIFRFALREIGEAPERSVHVGDGWSDIEGARRAQLRGSILYTGLRVYGARYRALNFAPDWERLQADHRVERLDQVPGVVRSLFASGSPP